MSRNKAKENFSLDDLLEQTQGVECRKDTGILDEIPGAYKPIEQVMANQSDLVEVVATLKQVVCEGVKNTQYGIKEIGHADL